MVLRVECHQINENHELYDVIDNSCWKSKNLYNRIRYLLKNKFKNDEKFSIAHSTLYKEYSDLKEKQELGSVISNLTIKQLSKDYKSSFQSYKKYKKDPSGFSGKPNFPDFKPPRELGRTKAAWQCNVRKDGTISIPKTDYKIDFLQNTDKKCKEVRFIPQPFGHIDSITHYNLELVYEIDVPEPKEETDRVVGIDLGLDRLATCVNNVGEKPIAINGKPVNSMNAYYNKKRAKFMEYVGDRGTSNRIRKLTKKRNNKIKHYFHCASRHIVDWCKDHNIDTIVIGENKGWKQESNMGKVTNQNWVSIPHNMLKEQIEYKAEEYGIKVVFNEESYTSKSSFLDRDDIPKYDGEEHDYDFSGYRTNRGMYKSYEHGEIHADVNGAYNIIRKKLSDIFDCEIFRHPRVVTVGNYK